jgi:hypothetical protein
MNELSLENAMDLLKKVYFAHSFDWNEIVQFIDAYDKKVATHRQQEKNVSQGDSTQMEATASTDDIGVCKGCHIYTTLVNGLCMDCYKIRDYSGQDF